MEGVNISPDHKYEKLGSKEVKQSQFTKEHLYDLDSDDDELDFLRKDVDFDARAKYRQDFKDEKKK